MIFPGSEHQCGHASVVFQGEIWSSGEQEFDNPKTLAAFALGLVLFLVTLAFNIVALQVVRRYREQYE